MGVFNNVPDENDRQAHQKAELERLLFVEIAKRQRGHGGAGARKPGQAGQGLNKPQDDAVKHGEVFGHALAGCFCFKLKEPGDNKKRGNDTGDSGFGMGRAMGNVRGAVDQKLS